MGVVDLIGQRIDRLAMTRRHWAWLFMAAVAWLIESYDIGLMGVVLVPFKTIWHLSASQTGILVASATVGIVVGVVPAGFLADRFGRKHVLVGALLFYSVMTALTGLATGWQAVAIMRFVAGIGLGAMFPLPYTLLVELSPRRKRGAVAGILDAFLSIGYFSAPVMAGWALTQYGDLVGWRVLFYVGGFGALYALVIGVFMPESPRWLAAHGKFVRADRILRKLEGPAGWEPSGDEMLLVEEAGIHKKTSARQALSSLWSPTYRRRSLMLWVAFPAVFFVFYAIMSYMPLVLKTEQFPAGWIWNVTALIMAASIPGKFLEAWLVEKLGRKPVIVGFTVVAALAAGVFPWAHGRMAIIVVAMILAFFGISVDPAMKIFTAEQYPTMMRGVGVGMTEGWGRLIGGALAPYIMALMLADVGIRGSFLFVALFAIVGAIVVALLGKETRGQHLEERVTGVEAEPEPAA